MTLIKIKKIVYYKIENVFSRLRVKENNFLLFLKGHGNSIPKDQGRKD